MVFLVVGDANVDLNGRLDRFPREGDDSALRDLAWSSGGTALNVATALGILGARVRLLARVGVDPAADVALRAPRRAGVDLEAVQRDEALSTGLCFAGISPGGERTFFCFRGANVALAPPDPDALFRGVTWLHIGGHALLEGPQRATTLALIDEASRRLLPISLDLCLPLIRFAADDVLALMPKLRVLFANEPELVALARCSAGAPSSASGAGGPVSSALRAVARSDGVTRADLEDALAALTPHDPSDLLFIAKGGARGSTVGASRLFVPGFAVDACDTTGCGDAFAAGFLFALYRGAPLEVCGRLANALGALTATRCGSADALPELGELCDFLAAQAAPRELALISPERRDLRLL
jgi:sugar/nucleoside kinase (ribokinase family)